MANFNTHLLFSVAAGSIVTGVAINAGLIDAVDAAFYLLMTVIGGMLPDVDANNSKPVKFLFVVLAGLATAGVAIALEDRFDTQQRALWASLAFLVVRYPVFYAFQKMTVHRGLFHSVLSAVFFGLLVTCGGYYFLHWSMLHAWLSGGFLTFGFIVHLCLDELFSVDLVNSRLKKSFGTALKLFSYNNKLASALLLILTLALFSAAPSPVHFVEFWKQLNCCFMTR